MRQRRLETQRKQRVDDQQQVRTKLQTDGYIENVLSNNPVEALFQKIGGAKTGKFYATQLNGKNALQGEEGSWRGSGMPSITVAGQTLNPMQRGNKVIYVSSSETTPNNSFLQTSKEVEEPSIVDGLDLNRPKPFAMTPEGQFERYFQTPEFDYVFGAGARGKDAPDSASAMQQLAVQEKAPMEQPLSSYYAAQSAMGRVNQDAIQNMYEGDENMQAWAKANPMLAQREYLKSEQRRANEMPLAPDNETVMGDLGSRAQGESGYTPESFGQPKPQGAKTPEEAKLKLFGRARGNK